MTFDDLVRHYGNANRAALALKIPRSTFYQWKEAGIPFEQQFRIQMKTKGKLTATMPSLNKRRAA
jgi:hypothetical protein